MTGAYSCSLIPQLLCKVLMPPHILLMYLLFTTFKTLNLVSFSAFTGAVGNALSQAIISPGEPFDFKRVAAFGIAGSVYHKTCSLITCDNNCLCHDQYLPLSVQIHLYWSIDALCVSAAGATLP